MNPDRPLPTPFIAQTPVKRSARCNFVDGPVDCTNRAQIHYLWVDGRMSNACFRHANDTERLYSYADKHTFGVGCLNDKAEWEYSLTKPPGCCRLPEVDDLTEFLTGVRREPVGTVKS